MDAAAWRSEPIKPGQYAACRELLSNFLREDAEGWNWLASRILGKEVSDLHSITQGDWQTIRMEGQPQSPQSWDIDPAFASAMGYLVQIWLNEHRRQTALALDVHTDYHNLYSLGYTGVPYDALLAYVERNNMLIIDTRFAPRSRVPQWNKGTLQKNFGDHYKHVGALGNVNFRSGPISIPGLDYGLGIIEYHLRQQNVILMCACAHVEECHRSVVGYEFGMRFHQPSILITPANIIKGVVPPNPVAPAKQPPLL